MIGRVCWGKISKEHERCSAAFVVPLILRLAFLSLELFCFVLTYGLVLVFLLHALVPFRHFVISSSDEEQVTIMKREAHASAKRNENGRKESDIRQKRARMNLLNDTYKVAFREGSLLWCPISLSPNSLKRSRTFRILYWLTSSPPGAGHAR